MKKIRDPQSAASGEETGGEPTVGGIPRKSALGVVYLTVFLDLLGFGIILPWLPYYAAELGASGVGLGFLFTSYSMAQLLGASVLGRLSDRLGRRPVLLLSLLGSGVGMIASGLATTLAALCLARAMAGLFGGSISTAQAYVADVCAPHERPRFMGMVGASIGLGFVVGPALGALFISLGGDFRDVAFTAAGLIFFNLGLAYFRLREPDRRTVKERRPWLESLSRPDLRRVLVASFLSIFAFVGLETTFAFLGRDRFGLDTRSFALVLTYVGVVLIIVQGGLIGPVSRRFGVRRVAVIGGSILGSSLALLPLAPSLAWALVVLGLVAFGQGLLGPTFSSLLSEMADVDEQGTVLGVGQSLSAAARALGPLVAGALFDLEAGLPYFVGGLLAISGALLVRGTTTRLEENPTE